MNYYFEGGQSRTARVVSLKTTLATPTTITGNSTVCSGSEYSYSTSAVAGATSYIWVLPSGWTGNSSTTSILTTPNTISGAIKVAATNSCVTGAYRSKSVSLAVCKNEEEGQSEEPLPVKESDEVQLKVYPNPFLDQFNVEFTSAELGAVELVVFDVTGRVVYKSSAATIYGLNKIEIDLSDQPSGA